MISTHTIAAYPSTQHRALRTTLVGQSCPRTTPRSLPSRSITRTCTSVTISRIRNMMVATVAPYPARKLRKDSS